jgi:hypothetical protein
MDWMCGSSSRTPVLQAQSPEFKPPVPSKTKKTVFVKNIFLLQKYAF